MQRKATLFGDIAGWRRERLGRKAVRRLYPILIRRYGKAERYTAGQVERALRISRLGRRYRPYAHAVFTNPAEVAKLAPEVRETVLPLTGQAGLATALQVYALSHLHIFTQAAAGGGDGFLGGDGGGAGGSIGDAGGGGGGDGGGSG